MAQNTELPYKFKLMGSCYVYPSQTWFYRAATLSFVVWAMGFIMVTQGFYGAGSVVMTGGAAVGLYIAEIGYRRGKTTD